MIICEDPIACFRFLTKPVKVKFRHLSSLIIRKFPNHSYQNLNLIVDTAKLLFDTLALGGTLLFFSTHDWKSGT